MRKRSVITMLVFAAAIACAIGCGDTILHDVTVEVAPSPKKPVGRKDDIAAQVFAEPKKPKKSKAMPVTFDDLNLNMQIDSQFRKEMLTEKVMSLIGKRVRLKGVMHGGILSSKEIESFVLLRNKETYKGPGTPADVLAEVKLRDGETVRFTPDTVVVEGTLRIEPKNGDDGNTWSLYILEEATVEKTP